MGWLARLFGWARGDDDDQQAATAAALPSPSPSAGAGAGRLAVQPAADGAAAAPAAAPQADTPPAAAEGALLLPWLLHCNAADAKALTPPELRVLDAFAKTLALPALPDELLPRAAALIPQLLAMLRQTSLPVHALAQRVARDAVLAAEVLRLASSPYYRAQGAVTDLAQAIALIGEQGLQTVIARVVLKPMYEAPAGTLSARSASRLWDHADALARHTADAARAAGQPVFDGYLAGLLHGSGWSVAFRTIERDGLVVDLPPSSAFAVACADSAHQLFGAAARRWDITPGFSEFGADARQRRLASSTQPLAMALRQAAPLAMAEMVAGTSH